MRTGRQAGRLSVSKAGRHTRDGQIDIQVSRQTLRLIDKQDRQTDMQAGS